MSYLTLFCLRKKKSGYGVGQIPRKCGEPEVGPAHQKGSCCVEVSQQRWQELCRDVPG